MSIDNQALRVAIISKLKEYEAYIDNELPDYIMVMVANKKTIHQIHTDLQLFLGDNTEMFVEWLQQILAHPELLSEPPQDVKASSATITDIKAESKSTSKSTVLAGSKRRSYESTVSQSTVSATSTHERSPSPHRPVAKAPRISSQEGTSSGRPASIRRSLESQNRDQERSRVGDSRKDRVMDRDKEREMGRGREKDQTLEEMCSSKDQDLRALIRKRRRKEPSPTKPLSGSEEEEETERVRVGLSSVVQRPERPTGRTHGTGRLLQRAIRGIHDDPRTSSRKPLSRPSKRSSGETSKSSSRSGPETCSRTSSETATIQSEINVEDDFVDEFREEQQQQLVLNDEQELEEKDDMVQAREEEMIDEEVEDTEVTHEEETRVGQKSGDARPTEKMTPVEAATLAAVRKVLPSQGEGMDLRLFLNDSRKTTKPPSTRFVVTMEGVERSRYITSDSRIEEDLDQGDEDDDLAAPRGGMPERCKFWPNCKNGDRCPYHHPTTPCRMFPNCKYGQKCCFVHPQCKFDSRCTRHDCPYLHTVRKPKIVPVPSPIMPIPAITPVPTFRPPHFMFAPSGGMGRPRGGRFPNKSALHWKPHVSERKFAVPDNTTSSMHV